MFSAADILEALAQRRRLKSIRPTPSGELPPGWKSWLEAMVATPRAVTGASPDDIIGELVARELAQPPTRTGDLTRWQAFATLWRQEWHAPMREERGVRIVAASVSAMLHLLFGILLLWLAFVHVLPPPAAQSGDNVVQVEFIGKGTPEDTGGGAPEGPQPTPEQAPAPAAAPPAAQAQRQEERPAPQPPAPAQPETPQPPVEPPPVAAQPEAVPEPAPVEPPPAPQPLQVTEVAQPDTTFVLPPTRPRDVTLPQREIVVPEARAPTERIARVERPVQERFEVERVTTQPTQVAPTLRAEQSARLAQTQAIAPSDVTSRDVAVPSVRAEVREIPMPSRGTTPGAQPGASTAATPSTTPGSAPQAATAPGGQPAPGSGVTPAAQPGAGTTPGAPPGAPPGALPSPQRGDDWGVGTRNRPGGTPGAPGVFRPDGTPNLGETPTPGRNAPGTLEAHVADLDRAGQWLKRPPYDYQPTTFDKYWRPHETLLQEWVRKGIKSITIPIPGTGKRLNCAISLLQLGGACGLTDPDANEQPASARPPPDVPFKPWLQEDNGSVRTAPPAPSTSARPPGG